MYFPSLEKSRTHLSLLDFETHNLTDTQLQGADLSGTDLSRVQGLRPEQIAGARTDENTRLPWAQSNQSQERHTHSRAVQSLRVAPTNGRSAQPSPLAQALHSVPAAAPLPRTQRLTQLTAQPHGEEDHRQTRRVRFASHIEVREIPPRQRLAASRNNHGGQRARQVHPIRNTQTTQSAGSTSTRAARRTPIDPPATEQVPSRARQTRVTRTTQSPLSAGPSPLRQAESVLTNFRPRKGTEWVDDPDWYPQFGDPPTIAQTVELGAFQSVSLSHHDLRGLDFGTHNLEGSTFDQADLRGADLSRTNVTRAQLATAIIDEHSRLPWRTHNEAPRTRTTPTVPQHHHAAVVTRTPQTNQTNALEALRASRLHPTDEEIIEQETFAALLDDTTDTAEGPNFTLVTVQDNAGEVYHKLYLEANWAQTGGVDPVLRQPVGPEDTIVVTAKTLQRYFLELQP